MSALVAYTCPANQWEAAAFHRYVDGDEELEARVAVAYDRPINRLEIRKKVISAILHHAIPAGNA